MGRDKALVEHDGRILAVRVADALRAAGADAVTCVGGDEAALRAAGLEVVHDAFPGEGPLGGILRALDHVGGAEVVVVLAVDLAHPDPSSIRAVVAALDDGADLAVPLVDGRRQWLHAAWRRDAAAPVLRAAFARGVRAVHRGVDGLRIRDVDGVEPRSVRDLDRPADLTALDRQQ
jgi:molybdopterin-guanine dinucleotide biosynthesis protein A